jgi:hypothetical protein
MENEGIGKKKINKEKSNKIWEFVIYIHYSFFKNSFYAWTLVDWEEVAFIFKCFLKINLS